MATEKGQLPRDGGVKKTGEKMRGSMTKAVLCCQSVSVYTGLRLDRFPLVPISVPIFCVLKL